MHISIIDDERLLTHKISKKLEGGGYSTSSFYGYEDFMHHGDIRSQLYIVDISLRDGSGFDIIKWLRSGKSRAPIIIISGYGDTSRITYGLDIGADDYLIKPVQPDELIARVRAILRRPSALVSDKTVYNKNIVFDRRTKEVWVDGTRVYLSRNEWLIFTLLVSNTGLPVSRERLIEEVWWAHSDAEISDNTINVTISKVRKKLGESFSPRPVYNHGYILES